MHKKVAKELKELAKRIEQVEAHEDLQELHELSRALYERLSVLMYLRTSEAISTEEDADAQVVIADTKPEEAVVEFSFEPDKDDQVTNEKEQFIEVQAEREVPEEEVKIPSSQITLEEELKSAVSSDEATIVFEAAEKASTVFSLDDDKKNRSLNDSLFKDNIQIDLNDRIAFVTHLFDGSQEDYSRVLSQLNTFKSQEEAMSFVLNFVKPDYDWSAKEMYEQRLIALIERKFT